jgi:hypothetical protein
MMAHGGLRQTERSRQLADARLAVGMGADDAQQSEARRVGEDPERRRQPFGRVLAERLGEDLRAALGVDRLDQFHDVILTAVDTSVNVSMLVDISRKEEGGVSR